MLNIYPILMQEVFVFPFLSEYEQKFRDKMTRPVSLETVWSPKLYFSDL